MIAALLWYFLAPGQPPPTPLLQNATLLPQPRQIADFRLTDHHGQPLDLARLRGHWTLMFFGYTHCPDVCPTTLQTLATVMKRLRAAGGESPLPQVIFVSVDPGRDTPARLASYVPWFDAAFVGATGAPDQLQRLTRQLGILYARDPAAGEDYQVDHSASVLLFDPEAHFRALFGAPQDPATLVADLQAIQHYYEAIRR